MRLRHRIRRLARANDYEIHAEIGARRCASMAVRLVENGCRLASVFAEDRTGAGSGFLIYYVFDHPRTGAFFWSAFGACRSPAFPSVAAEIPAVNWQEREIQDWFGLVADGHPNPRRVALHDNWPDVHPLRKDFPIDTVLPPFEGEQHVYRPTLRRGSLPDSRRACSCGHHRAGPLQLRGCRRADPLSATAHVLHPQGNRKAI
jgi:Ni,Fe-hydrogenase III component G